MWSNPNYELSGLDFANIKGQIPRAISLMRTSYTSVVTSGPFGKVWFGVDAPATSVFVPFYTDVLANGGGNYSTTAFGTQTAPQLKYFDRNTAWWAHSFVANFMAINYVNMSKQMVYPARDELQAYVMHQVASTEQMLLQSTASVEEKGKILGDFQNSLQDYVTKKWWELADNLVVRYNDGYYSFSPEHPDDIKLIEYPVWYMKMIGFNDDFYRSTLHWFTPSQVDTKENILAGLANINNNNTATTTTTSVESDTTTDVVTRSGGSVGSFLMSLLGISITLLCVFAAGMLVGIRRERKLFEITKLNGGGEYTRLTA